MPTGITPFQHLNSNLTEFMSEARVIRKFRILTVAFCLSVVSFAQGSQPKLTTSPISSMLKQPTVTAIHRDSKGILWIGTQQGLHRFDGANLTVFNSDRSHKNWIPDSEIKGIGEDKNSNIFVITSGGVLLKLNRRTERFESIAYGSQSNQTRFVRLLVSNHGSVWLLSKDELILYDPRFRNTAEWVMDLDLLKSIGTPHEIIEDSYGDLWIGGDLGLVRIFLQDKSLVSFDLETVGLPEHSSITALKINNEGNLIIGTNTGHIVVWDIEASKILFQATVDGDGQSLISQFLPFEDKLIIGTDSGLFVANKNLSVFKNLSDNRDDSSDPDIYSLYRDGKYVWVGKIDGLDILTFSQFELFNLKKSGVSSHVLAFHQDSGGSMWVGTYSGLYIYDNDTQYHIMFNFNSGSAIPIDKRITTLIAKKNSLWLGLFQGGVQIVDITNGRSKSLKLSTANDVAVTKILTDDNSEDVWIATYNQGLFRYTAGAAKSYYDIKSLPEKSVTVLFRSNNSALFAASENRVYKYDPQIDQFNKLPFEFRLDGHQPFIYSIAEAHNDDIVIGTKDHGVFIWPRANQARNQFNLLQPANGDSGLATSTIYGIEPDAEGNLWCSTQNGIVKLDSGGQLIKRFTTADGLQGNDFAFGSSFTSREGLIYFGGVNGYNRFDPSKITIDNSASPMILTRIELPKNDNRNMGDVNELKSLQLTHKDYFVTFQFSVLDFIDPEKNQFRYKLENFDPEWIENGNRNTATYTNLPAGEYILQVQGANSAGIWNRDGVRLAVRVLPAPWFTWWAFIIYGLMLLSLLWSARRIYRSYASDKEKAEIAKALFETENQADDDMQEQLELQDQLIHSNYQHNLTTLTLVSNVISHRSIHQSDSVSHELTESSVKRIAALSILEDCLSYQTGRPAANLHKFADSIIAELLKNSPVRPETIISLNEISSLPIPAELASPLSVVIFELLENCIQHAFEPDSLANYIQIKLAPGGNSTPTAPHLELTVRDSGIGIPDCIEILAWEGSGIGVVQLIVEMLGGTLQISGTTGTVVSISIPNTSN